MTTTASPAPTTTIPTAEEYRRVLLEIRDARETKPVVWEQWVNLLRTQYQMPGRDITMAQLATAHRMTSETAAETAYGKLAKAVAERMQFVPAEQKIGRRGPMWWMALSAAAASEEANAPLHLVMHASLAQSLERMRWVSTPAG